MSEELVCGERETFTLNDYKSSLGKVGIGFALGVFTEQL